MKNIAAQLENIYKPIKALIIYGSPQSNVYVEAYDMDKQGHAINAHPLAVQESSELATILDCSEEMQRDFLRPRGILPNNLIYLNPSRAGFAIWHTPAREVNLFFASALGLNNGKAKVPPMIWKASKSQLEIFALNTTNPPQEKTPLCKAPFFNVYPDGKVCMGTVDIEIPPDCMLEEFIQTWEDYFFKSYFSHQLDTKQVNGNLTSIWKTQLETGKEFPLDTLLQTDQKIKKLFV